MIYLICNLTTVLWKTLHLRNIGVGIPQSFNKAFKYQKKESILYQLVFILWIIYYGILCGTIEKSCHWLQTCYFLNTQSYSIHCIWNWDFCPLKYELSFALWWMTLGGALKSRYYYWYNFTTANDFYQLLRIKPWIWIFRHFPLL